ncbi:MAG: SDR family NAD(P)-dependent oxidoreductase [Alphaproteobacteria bacterium]|nr:SDR family NAD(P)-dependent oxidoreductase [Alphaproteobacteria bacterium]
MGEGRVQGKVALVTGAGAIGPGWGNGKAAAVLYAREGARVFAVDNRAEVAEETRAIIEEEGGECRAHVADVTDADAVAAMVAACMDAFGRIDILHNNVGGQGPGRKLEDITLEDWHATLDRNATSVLLTCRQVAPIMAAQGGGAIVNISSVASIRHLNVPTTTYSAAKGAVNELTKNIALQYAPHKVRANCVLPGYIDTPFIQRTVGGRKSFEYKGYASAEEYRAARDAIVPLGRMGTAWDVARAALFLASDDASYVTAQCLVVDGGVTATCPGV